jgi:hypothetical protein
MTSKFGWLQASAPIRIDNEIPRSVGHARRCEARLIRMCSRDGRLKSVLRYAIKGHDARHRGTSFPQFYLLPIHQITLFDSQSQPFGNVALVTAGPKLLAIREKNQMIAVEPRPDLAYAVDVHNCGTVNTQEVAGIKFAL